MPSSGDRKEDCSFPVLFCKEAGYRMLSLPIIRDSVRDCIRLCVFCGVCVREGDEDSWPVLCCTLSPDNSSALHAVEGEDVFGVRWSDRDVCPLGGVEGGDMTCRDDVS